MRTVHSWQTEEESYESQREAGRYNPSLELTFRDKKGIHKGVLGAGRSDSIYVHRDGDQTYVLSMNTPLGYVGLQAWREDSFDDIVVLQDESDIEETLGKDGLDKSPIWITKVLSQWDQ